MSKQTQSSVKTAGSKDRGHEAGGGIDQSPPDKLRPEKKAGCGGDAAPSDTHTLLEQSRCQYSPGWSQFKGRWMEWGWRARRGLHVQMGDSGSCKPPSGFTRYARASHRGCKQRNNGTLWNQKSLDMKVKETGGRLALD